MKRINKSISITSLFIAVVILGYWLFTNSNYYKTKQALKTRDEKINQLNGTKRQYIYEGVYIFHQPLVKYSQVIDKFGNKTKTEQRLGIYNYEVAFTSNKLTILNERNKTKEELTFNKDYVITEVTDSVCKYKFTVIKWHVYNLAFNSLIHDIIKENDYSNIHITLHVPKDSTPFFHNDHSFRSVMIAIDPDAIFMKNYYAIFIDLKTPKYKYPSIFVPDYVHLAKYEKYIYDPKTYMTN